MAISEHNEIEAKLDATGVDIDEFRRWAFERMPERYVCVSGPDHYYSQGDNIVRHRRQDDSTYHELTVKRRKSEKSTRDRLEIDLKFDPKTQTGDVHMFLAMTGYDLDFILWKRAHIFWFKEGNTHLSVVIYDVYKTYEESTTQRRFIEIEAEKGSAVTPEHAKKRVNAWVKDIQKQFKLKGEPLNDSLYEIYSGRKYQIV